MEQSLTAFRLALVAYQMWEISNYQGARVIIQNWAVLLGKDVDDGLERFESDALDGVARTYVNIVSWSPPPDMHAPLPVDATHAEAVAAWEYDHARVLRRRRDAMIAYIEGLG
jgi:hypothetical protein